MSSFNFCALVFKLVNSTKGDKAKSVVIPSKTFICCTGIHIVRHTYVTQESTSIVVGLQIFSHAWEKQNDPVQVQTQKPYLQGDTLELGAIYNLLIR